MTAASHTVVSTDDTVIVEAGELGYYPVVKRLADIMASIILLVIFSPLMILLFAAVRLDSKGPIVFKQRRVGRGGVPFTLYKFRTMQIDAPTLTTEDMKRSHRSYYTRIGLVLRRFSIDELPQLVNVLCGDMSMIGPRPSLESQEWLNERRQHCRVYELRPGITGWAQVSGRDELTDTEKTAYDAEYRAQCSFILDVRIALMTLKAVFTGDGAN
jgi:O-antigen biosynthesis protein WbqP